jgi:hypothetical protein
METILFKINDITRAHLTSSISSIISILCYMQEIKSIEYKWYSIGGLTFSSIELSFYILHMYFNKNTFIKTNSPLGLTFLSSKIGSIFFSLILFTKNPSYNNMIKILSQILTIFPKEIEISKKFN